MFNRPTDIVGTLETDILPYVLFLIVPVLGRVSDTDETVRKLATSTFAALVKLVPLEVCMWTPEYRISDNILGRLT